MKILSLFDGIACGYEALLRAGIKIDKYYSSEIDKYAIQIANKNHSDIKQLGDITKIKYGGGRIDYEKGNTYTGYIDLLIGGSPCQGFSVAGRQLAFEDPRSKLFFEFVRLKEEIKPRYFLLENVKMRKERVDIISEYLGVDPIEINSSLVSAQNRKRLYWTNIPGIIQPKDKGIILKDILEKDIEENNYIVGNQYNNRIFTDKSGTLGTCMGRTAKQGIGVYREKISPETFIRKLSPIECERLQTLPDNYTEGVSNTQRYKALGNGRTVDIIAHILGYIAKGK